MIDTKEMLSSLEEEERRKILQSMLDRRVVYSSENGIELLTEILTSAHMFSTTETETEQAERNFAIHLLEGMGCLERKNAERIVEFILSLPIE